MSWRSDVSKYKNYIQQIGDLNNELIRKLFKIVEMTN